MRRLCVYVCVCFAVFFQVQGQRSFSEDKDVFFNQAISRLNAVGTEPAKKVAFDFGNAWRGKFTDQQQENIHDIALQMDKKGYGFHPYFWYYFSYLAYCTAQAGLVDHEVSNVLEINQQMVKAMEPKEYKNFLLGLNMFMARRILGQSKSVLTLTDGGSFQFKMLEGYEVIEDEEVPDQKDDTSVPEPIVEEVIEEEPPTHTRDLWSGSNPWNDNNTDDAWAEQNDPWADDSDPWNDSGNDPWGSDNEYDDNWVESEDTWGYDATGEVFEENTGRQFVETIAQDYVAGLKAKYVHPEISGPVIELENNSMLISTPFDSFNIKETDGKYLLKNRTYAGENAVINWPLDNKNARGAVVNLDQFYIRADRSDFWTPNAKLTFPALFSGTTEGSFQFRSVRRKNNTLSKYPIFTSNHSDLDIKMPGRKVKYRGGIEISGDEFAGTSVSRIPGKLTILDGKGNKAIFRAVRFEFGQDSVISSLDSKFTLLHGSDSLYHPSVEVYFDSKTNDLTVLKTKRFDVTPFYSTYFQVNVNAEIVKWSLDTDSISFSILNGKDLLPVTFESKDFFNDVRLSKLNAGFRFHPVLTSVYYANLYNTREFAAEELSTHFEVDIKEVRNAMKVLKRYGFAKYNAETGLVQLNDLAFHYYNASAGKVDYDNLMIPSVEPGKPNAVWRLDSGDMKVSGVDRFYFTSDYKIYAEPFNQEMTLLKGRDIDMDGMINAGTFQYKGKNFEFNYDQFLVQLNQVDSIRIEVTIPDSLRAEGQAKKTPLKNHLNQTSGTLYIDYPDNKSGLRESNRYPDFVSDSEAVVYFDGPEVLNGAYDKSVRFIIPPFETDSMTEKETLTFTGVFNSGGIFPTFDETLTLQADQSLGFVHQIPPEGYNLYGTEAKTYEKISLSNRGLRGGGKIDFITSTVFSNDFVYYPDSVAAVGTGGFIGPGEVNGASYPEAVLGPFRMHWQPRIDSMNLRNLRDPFKFYNATAELDGGVNITANGVYGLGTMFTRGSRAKSNELTFKQYSYSARHADFEVLTDIPNKPAMEGKDIRLNFDLKNGTALINPEREGVASISFPYAQMNTSITKAVWDLDDSVVTMTKPVDVPLSSSYFYTTRPELDSLAFNAEEATYDFNTKELYVTGIPYIIVADAKVIPENYETTILENAELQPFNNAELIIDTLKEYHYLFDGQIKILSRNEFTGTATYQLVTGVDTFNIQFNKFELQEVQINEEVSRRMTVSGGEVPAKSNLIIAPGFYYKGGVTMYAHKKPLDLDGAVKLMFDHVAYDHWILYERTDDNVQVSIDMETALFDDEEPVIAGLHYDARGSIYTTFVNKRQGEADADFFRPKGRLEYNDATGRYRIETPAKTSGESYNGYTMIYDDKGKDIIFEGKVDFFNPYNDGVKIDAAVLGSGNMESSEYSIDAFLKINIGKSAPMMKIMATEFLDIIERLGPPVANDISIELLYKMASLTSDEAAKTYETSSLKEYTSLLSVAESLEQSLVISGVKMNWSKPHAAWYNTTKLGISNILDNDINAKLDGFIEIKKDDANNDVLNLFIQAAPGTWYFISYADNNLMMFSSNGNFNDQVQSNSNLDKAKPGELVLVLGDENETLSFINNFREKYFGVTEPYDLVYPEEISLDDESFDTIEKEDDGFGF